MRELLLRFAAVGVAGFFGSVARWLVGISFGRLNSFFPVGTMFINLTGSLFLGWFMTVCQDRYVPPNLRLAIGVGFVGAYTTFSTYMWESSKLASDDAQIKALLNVIGSVVLGLLAVRLGIFLGRRA